jgi:hypothetical protein
VTVLAATSHDPVADGGLVSAARADFVARKGEVAYVAAVAAGQSATGAGEVKDVHDEFVVMGEAAARRGTSPRPASYDRIQAGY